MKRKILAVMLAGVMVLGAVGCGRADTETKENEEASAEVSEENAETDQFDETTVTIFAAKSLNGVVDELIAMYQEKQPNVEIVPNYDSSGTLMAQIQEGAACDIFFSAAQKQMDQLEADGLVAEGTRTDVVNNQVCVVTYKNSGTKVTGLADIAEAESFALADGSVPVGKYTRQALVSAGMLEQTKEESANTTQQTKEESANTTQQTEDVSAITTQQVSEVLGGIEINECANVGAVTAAVAEGSNEVGTVYRSDTYGLEEQLEILEIIGYDLTGDVIYPIGQIVNSEAGERQREAALDFMEFLTSDEAKEVYEKYYFDTEV